MCDDSSFAFTVIHSERLRKKSISTHFYIYNFVHFLIFHIFFIFSLFLYIFLTFSAIFRSSISKLCTFLYFDPKCGKFYEDIWHQFYPIWRKKERSQYKREKEGLIYCIFRFYQKFEVFYRVFNPFFFSSLFSFFLLKL